MTDERAPGPAEKALSSTERHGRSLEAVNEKLAELVASLRDQSRRLAGYSQPAPPPAADGEKARSGASDAEGTLAAELALAKEALERRAREEERLRDRLAEIEAENRRVLDEFVGVREQNAELVSLYAAIERMHGARTRRGVLAAVQEIVVDLVGSEELVLFELAPGGRLVPAHSFGVDPTTLRDVAVGSGVVGRAAADGRAWIAGDAGAPAAEDDPRLTACVPLKQGDEVAGVLAVYRLLGHKAALTDFDRELLALVERHAAVALHHGADERPAGAG